MHRNWRRSPFPDSGQVVFPQTATEFPSEYCARPTAARSQTFRERAQARREAHRGTDASRFRVVDLLPQRSAFVLRGTTDRR